jgi:hypothetical protein
MKRINSLVSMLILAGLLLSACSTTAAAGTAAIISDDSKTIVASTPTNDSQTLELIELKETPQRKIDGKTGGPGNGGPPPEGTPGDGGGSSAEDGLNTASGTYTLNGETDTLSNETLNATEEDQSAVYTIHGARLTLTNVIVNTGGNSSSEENSSFYGLNAGVLAASASTITMKGGSITTSGSGANGAFSTGEGSVVNLTDVTIIAGGSAAHGVMATQGGQMTLTNVNITTSGRSSAPIATDRGSGSITVVGGTVNTSGEGSPCYYSTGVLDITENTCLSTGTESAVIEGSNSILLTNSTLTSSAADSKGVMIYQSFSGDAEGSDGVFNMTGGSLAHTASDGPLFYVTNTTGYITLNGVKVKAASGILLRTEGNDRWGTQGENGGTAFLTADEQTLNGDFSADAISRLNITLQNKSTLSGAINADNTAKSASLTLDGSSSWSVTADSHITCLTDSTGISGATINNITGNGYTVYYNVSACPALNGKTYSLVNGGTLQPAS